MILNAAVDDKKIVSNPFAAKSIQRPRHVPTKVQPWSVDRLTVFRAKLPDCYRVAVDLGAGCGLRQGEIFGVSPDDVDVTRPTLRVVRQIKLVRGALIFAHPRAARRGRFPSPPR